MRRFPLMFLAPLALLAASCGGGGGSASGGNGGSLAKGDVAVVDGSHITRSDLDSLMQQAKCSSEAQKQTFPAAGSPEYQQLQGRALQYLVQNTELKQQAPKLGASVSDKQVAARLTQIKKQYFRGSEKQYRANLKRSCTTDAAYREQLRSQLLTEAIYSKLTKGVQVSDGDAKAYYDANPSKYAKPQSRLVRHILVKSKTLADKLYGQLKGGADFTTLVKKYSTDPGSKATGGKYTVPRDGSFVKAFENTAFALKTGEISKPVHTQFGWHIIQALKPAKPRQTTPFSQVKASIKQQLLQQKRDQTAQTWLDGVKKQYASKISYATGFAPATTSTSTTSTTG
jgi:foldase protein PrsA